MPRNAAVPTDAMHRVTPFEVFFDLVFVFAFTRIVAFMAQDLTAAALVRGLLLLLLVWWAWSAYCWLGNQARADTGPALISGLAAMVAISIVGLLLPQAWSDPPGGIRAPLVLAVAYCAVRALYIVTYWYAAGDDQQLRHQLRRSAIPSAVAVVPFLAGAVIGGTAQILLWTLAFAIDFGGGRLSSAYGGYRVRSPGYFAERHGLVVIIALGESITAVGTGVGDVPITLAILAGATLGLLLTIALWLLYFRGVAPVTERRLTELEGSQRAWLARDVGTLLHFPLIAGIFYVAVGVEQVLAGVSGHEVPGRETSVPVVKSAMSEPLGWLPLIAMLGGVALYLAGLIGIRRRTTGDVPSPWWWAAVALPPVLIPLLRQLPALGALAVTTAALLALAGVVTARHRRDRVSQGTPEHRPSTPGS